MLRTKRTIHFFKKSREQSKPNLDCRLHQQGNIPVKQKKKVVAEETAVMGTNIK